MMKKLAAAIFAVVVMVSAAAAYNLDFTILNETGSRITRIYLSPSWEESFDPDRHLVTRGRNGSPTTIFDGDSEKITFDNVNSDYKNSAMWDMYIFCADGREKMFRRIDLSEVMVVRIDSYLSISKFTALDILEAL